jgi:hypothetical protein
VGFEAWLLKIFGALEITGLFDAIECGSWKDNGLLAFSMAAVETSWVGLKEPNRRVSLFLGVPMGNLSAISFNYHK